MADKIRVGIVGATVTPGGSGWGANAHVQRHKLIDAIERSSATGRSVRMDQT
jgi:PII-like signaling protein